VPDAAPFHDDLRRLAPVLPRSAVGPRRLAAMRALQSLQRGRRDVEVVRLGPVSMRVHRPPGGVDGPRPAVLWIHGGGYVMGHAAQEDGRCRELARVLDAVVAAVDHRLAPEHRFPVPLHDCHDALEWLAVQDDVDEARIAIGGTSAGGGLAAALALLARDRDVVHPVFQLLVYPMLDDRSTGRVFAAGRRFRLWNSSANRFGWRSYLGREPGSDGVSGLAAPARAEDLSGLPPAWIGVGTLDLFHDEDVAYARRLRAAGVACELDVVEGAYHGFDVVQSSAAVSRSFHAAQVDAFARALGAVGRDPRA
jgi:acetyl esterase/lipase